jgi:hypothetical protein
LESRLTPYVLSGYKWGNTAVTASFVPDATQTDTSGVTSNLFASLNAIFGSASTWQYQYAKALQTWAYYSPLNYHFVSDNGAAWNSSGPAQGDANFGDTRFFGYTNPHGFNGGYSYSPVSYATGGGDSNLATNTAWKIGIYPDLYSLLLHETGLTVGLGETSSPGAVMYPQITTVYTGLTGDDIAGIQAIYGARPSSTIYSDNLATAYALSLNSSGAVTVNTSLETQTDADYFAVTVPTGGNGTLTVTLDARDYSLLIPQLTVYDSTGAAVGSATASTYGQTLTLNFSGLTAGQVYKIGVSPAAGVGYFSVGAYALTIQFGGVSGTPSPPALDKYDPNSTAATAANLGTLGSITVNSLTISSSTESDYFSFTAGSTGTYNVSTSFTQVGGTGGSLSTSVLNSSLTALGTATSTSGSESLSVSLTSGQTYYIEVWSPTGSWFDYSLSVTAPSGTPSGGAGNHHGHGNGGTTGNGHGGEMIAPNIGDASTPVPAMGVASPAYAHGFTDTTAGLGRLLNTAQDAVWSTGPTQAPVLPATHGSSAAVEFATTDAKAASILNGSANGMLQDDDYVSAIRDEPSNELAIFDDVG